MSQPLIATGRVVFQYTVGGFLHEFRAYCKIGTPISGVQQVGIRDGVSHVSLPAAAQAGWDAMSAVFAAGVLAPVVTLQQRVGIVWNPIAVATVTGHGLDSAYNPASQLTVVLRDTSFKPIRVTLMEHSDGYIGHAANGLGITSNIDTLVASLTGTDANAAGFYQWQVSRGNRFILGVGGVAGATLDLNDKLKRSRHIE